MVRETLHLMDVTNTNAPWFPHFFFKLNTSAHRWYCLLSMHNTSASKQTGLLSSESSDSNTDEESLFGPPSGRSRWEDRRGRSGTPDLWASSNRPSESIRRGSDRELRAFINMRDQADKATEVGTKKATRKRKKLCIKQKKMTFWSRCWYNLIIKVCQNAADSNSVTAAVISQNTLR